MEAEQPLMRVDSTATGRCQQCALHALCLFEIIGCLNTNLASIVADDITVPKCQTLYCRSDTASNLHMVESSGFKIITPLHDHDAHSSGISNAR